MELPLIRRNEGMVFAALVTLMALTRLPMAAGPLHLQDASWAVFFVAGFYLRQHWRWAFPALMAEAVLVDLVAIQWLGTSNYCLTVAYWFLVPSHAVLWLGGAWLAERLSLDARGAARLALSVATATSLCFLISNGSFYWLGERAAAPTWAGWIENMGHWYWPFVSVAMGYCGSAALLHLVAVHAQSSRMAVAR